MWLLNDLDLFIAPRHNRGNTSCSSLRQTAATSRRHTAANLAKPNTPDGSRVHIDSSCFMLFQQTTSQSQGWVIIDLWLSGVVLRNRTVYSRVTKAKVKSSLIAFKLIKITTSKSLASASISEKLINLHYYRNEYRIRIFILSLSTNAFWTLNHS